MSTGCASTEKAPVETTGESEAMETGGSRRPNSTTGVLCPPYSRDSLDLPTLQKRAARGAVNMEHEVL